MPKGKFSHGVGWMLGSYLIMGISGLSLTYVIARWATPTQLGVFHQAMALYFFMSHFTTLGQQHAILRFLPLQPQPKACLQGALINAALFACIGTLLLYVGISPVSQLFGSPALGEALHALLPALWLFPITKVLMNALNASQRMASLAIGNSIRYVCLPLSAWAWLHLGQNPNHLSTILVFGEIILLVFGLWQWRQQLFSRWQWPEIKPWCLTHRRFGQRSVAAGMIADLNTRLDVLLLGLLSSDATVGLYSVVATIGEGLTQLLIVFRTNVNPILAQTAQHGWQRASKLRQKLRWLVPASLTACALGWGLYPWGITLLQLNPDYLQAHAALGVILLGMALSASHLPFSSVLQQCGHPIAQTLQVATVALLNTIGNLLLIPSLGLLGAATATAMAQVAMALYTEMAYRWCENKPVPTLS